MEGLTNSPATRTAPEKKCAAVIIYGAGFAASGDMPGGGQCRMKHDNRTDRPAQSELVSDLNEPDGAEKKLNGFKASAGSNPTSSKLVDGTPKRWPDPVDGAELLDGISTEITRYLSLPP